MEKQIIKNKKEKTMKLSVKEGSATAFMSGAGEAYIVPYALALNASNIQIGFLTSFVNLFGAASQIVGGKLGYYFERRKILLFSVFLQATMWLLILGLGILVWKGIINGYSATILLVLYCLYAIIGNISGPAWFSLMGDIVPEKKRGDYFSKRNKIVLSIASIVTLIAAFFLDYMKSLNLILWGFAIIFATASLGRYISAFLFTKHYYPKNKLKKESYFGFFQFLKKSYKNNFGRFVIYVGLINLATNFSAPFFAVYMLRELHYSYTWFTIITLSAAGFTVWSMPIWGRVGDRFGNRKLLAIGSSIIPFSSLLWLISKNPIVIIFTAQLAAGIGWAAFNLAASNFIYDAVSSQRRSICVAYFNSINGIGIFIGASLGALFAQYAHPQFMNLFLLIFLISGIARALVVIIFLPKIKEVRVKFSDEKINILNYIATGTPRPFYGVFRGVLSIMTNFTGKINKNDTSK